MTPIADIDVYTSGMQKSIKDKLWFMDMLDPSITTVYDYGCADGALLKEIHKLRPDLRLIGYDNSEEMVELACNNCKDAHFYNKPITSIEPLLLVASSVFHEIHSYSKDIQYDYDSIFKCGAKYIAIRDMFYSEEDLNGPVFDIKDYGIITSSICKDNDTLERFNEFYDIWNVRENKDSWHKFWLHYLLKYRYTSNWEREVCEDYLPHSLEEFLKKIPNIYEIVYLEHYTLPFLKDQVKKDFGIDLKAKTHAKILLRLKDN